MKKVGDLICKEILCTECPLHCVSCEGSATNLTMKEILKNTLSVYPELEPMRTYFEAELDKEVEE